MPYKSTSTTNRSESTEFADGSESEYESDGETKYAPQESLGQGNFAKARLFRSSDGKKVTVLNPVNIPGDMDEAQVKYRFFQTVYPQDQSHLFINGADYRLVVPYIEYTPFKKLVTHDPEQQRLLFLSAAKALKDCHDKGLILIDIKTDNIYYDSMTQQSYFIDGGYSVPMGDVIDPKGFQKRNQQKLDEFRAKYIQIAPECWSVWPTAVFAAPAMDIYALGRMMRILFKNPDTYIKTLIDSCLEIEPQNRPTSSELISLLDIFSIQANELAEHLTGLDI